MLATAQAEQPFDGVIWVAEQRSSQVIVGVSAGELEAVVPGVPVRDIDALPQPIGCQEHHGQGESCDSSYLQEPQGWTASWRSELQQLSAQSVTLNLSITRVATFFPTTSKGHDC